MSDLEPVSYVNRSSRYYTLYWVSRQHDCWFELFVSTCTSVFCGHLLLIILPCVLTGGPYKVLYAVQWHVEIFGYLVPNVKPFLYRVHFWPKQSCSVGVRSYSLRRRKFFLGRKTPFYTLHLYPLINPNMDFVLPNIVDPSFEFRIITVNPFIYALHVWESINIV